VEHAAEGVKLFGRTIADLEEVHKNRIEQVVLRIKVEKASSEQLKELKKQLLYFRGKYPVRIEFNHSEFKTRLVLPDNISVVTTPQMIESINKIFGYPVVHLQ
jgi:hypothetical protein